MTVCVAGIAAGGDSIIAVSDRRITYGDIAADVASVEKTYRIHPKWVAMFAGNDIGNVTPILDRVQQKLSAFPSASRIDVAREFRGAFRAHRRTLIEERVLASLDMDVKEFRIAGLAQLGLSAFEELRTAADATKVNCEFLICGFSGVDPQIFAISDEGLSYYERIGFWSIGSGGYSAISSLAFRQYHRGMSFQQALYHVLEAKFMADTSVPTVGKATLTLIIKRDGGIGQIEEASVDRVREIWQTEGSPRTPVDLAGRMPSAIYSAVGTASGTSNARAVAADSTASSAKQSAPSDPIHDR